VSAGQDHQLHREAQRNLGRQREQKHGRELQPA
jgi:hypothetical protein